MRLHQTMQPNIKKPDNVQLAQKKTNELRKRNCRLRKHKHRFNRSL